MIALLKSLYQDLHIPRLVPSTCRANKSQHNEPVDEESGHDQERP